MPVSLTVATPYFPPERGAPQQRWGELVALLRRQGLSVDVITNFPHYPGGSTYPGYRWRPTRRESWRGVPVVRVGNMQAANRGFLPRLIDQLTASFVLALCLLVRRRRADWVICEMPPVFAALPFAAAMF